MKKVLAGCLMLVMLLSACASPATEVRPGNKEPGGERSSVLKAASYEKDGVLDSVSDEDLGASFSCMAKTAYGSLFVDRTTGEIAVRDDGGNLWRSAMTDAQMDMDLLTPGQKKIVTTPMTLEYTFLNTRSGVTTRSSLSDLKPEITVMPIENGACVVYYAADISVRIYVEVTLEGGALRVRIPEDGIEEGVGIGEQITAAREKMDEYFSWIGQVIDVMEEDGDVSRYRSRIGRLKSAFTTLRDAVYEIDDAVDIKTEIDQDTELLEDVKGIYKGGVGDTGLFNQIAADTAISDAVKNTYKAVYNKFDNYMTQIKLLMQQLSSIKYGALTTLFLYPNFGALEDTAEGYAFYPDGCGAVSYSSTEHPSYSAYFLKDVYTGDQMGITEYMEDGASAEKILMPVFGVKRGSAAYVAVIDEGTAYGAVQYSPSGLNVDAQRVNAGFRCRRLATVYEEGDSRGSIFEVSRFTVPFSVNYYFLQDDDADYSGMANRYRGYLLEKGLLRKSSLTETSPVALNLVMGVIKRGLFANEFKTATTFAEAEKMAEYFSENGTDILFNIEGYTKQGYSQPFQADTDAASGIGGNKGLQQFVTAAGGRGYKVFLENGYTAVLKSSSVFGRSDYVYDSSGTTLSDANHRIYLVNPRSSLRFLTEKQLPVYSAMGVSGISFRQIGSGLFYDYNTKNEIAREETMDVWEKMFAASSGTLGSTAVFRAGQYAFKDADWIPEAPSQSTGYVYTDESVPFYQIVLHGYVLYSSKAFNKFYDTQYEKMKAIEYGAIPVFTLTACETSELKKTSCRNEFSTSFDDWKESIVQIGKEFSELSAVSSEAIVRHERISDTLVRVRYANGMVLLLNYSDSEVTQDGMVIGPMDYRLFR